MRSFLILLGVVAGSLQASAATYTVYPDGSGDFPTIQAALYAASDGDTVQLGDGTFSGPGNRNLDTNETNISIVALSNIPGDCRIDCEGSAAEPYFGISYSTQGPGTLLRGVVIVNGYGNPTGGALRLDDASITIENCYFAYNDAWNFGGAVAVTHSSFPTFRNCHFYQNNALYYGQGGALYFDGTCNPTFEACSFSENTADQGGAVYFSLGSPTITQSTFFKNLPGSLYLPSGCNLTMEKTILAYNRGPGGPVAGSGLATLTCCDIYGNLGGNWIGGIAGQFGLDGNISADPQFIYPQISNFNITPASPCGPYVNPACGRMGVGLVEDDVPNYRLQADGQGMFPTIQAAINTVPNLADIWLEPGTYSGPGNRDLDLMGKDVNIFAFGGYPDGIVLDAGGSASDPHRHFNATSGSTNILNQLKLVNGYASGALGTKGGSVLVSGTSDLMLSSCIFENNFAPDSGSDVHVQDGERLYALNCQFINSSQRFSVSGETVHDFEIRNGSFTGDGGGVVVDGSGSNCYLHVQHVRFEPSGGPSIDIRNLSGYYTSGLVETSTFAAALGYSSVRVENSQNIQISACTMSTELTSLGEDRVVALDSTVDFDDCVFSGGAENPAGRAVLGTNANLTFSQCDFMDYNSSPNEGIVSSMGGTLGLDGCNFTNSSTCVSLTDVSESSILNSTFSGNQGTPALGVTNSSTSVSNSSFTNNTSSVNGGAIASTTSNLSLDTCTLQGNTSQTKGGAIIVEGGVVSLTNCLLEGNQGSQGGAIHSHIGSTTLTGSTFSGNTALYGGAISGFNTALNIVDCDISGNNANQHGGIYLNNCDPSLVDGCLISNNTVVARGSGIGIASCDPTISACTIVGNSGSGAWAQVACEFTCAPNITSTIIAYGLNGPAMYATHPDLTTVTADCVDVVGNPGGDYVGPLAGLGTVNNNISTDPLFCDAGTGDFHLASNSPCAAANNACGVNAGAFGVGCTGVTPVPDQQELPRTFAVLGNFPNPFNPQTDIAFGLPVGGPVTVAIYDMNGRLVRQLVGGESYPAGNHQVTWDGRDDGGQAQSSGIYLYRVTAGGTTLGGKMAMIR